MQPFDFQRARDLWARNEPADGDDWEALEAVILARAPSTAADAIVITEVLIANVQLGQRSDGLDIAALESLLAWLRRQPERQAA